MTATAASRANMIRAELGALTLTAAHIETQMAKAYKLKDWEALGYPDWAAYCQGEYGTHLATLGAGLRTMMRTELTMAGATVGEIAAACGVNRRTIQRDMRPAATYVAPAPAPVTVIVTPEPADRPAPVPEKIVIVKQDILTCGQCSQRFNRGEDHDCKPAQRDWNETGNRVDDSLIREARTKLARERNTRVRRLALELRAELADAPAGDDSPSTRKALDDVFAVLRDRLAPGGPVWQEAKS